MSMVTVKHVHVGFGCKNQCFNNLPSRRLFNFAHYLYSGLLNKLGPEPNVFSAYTMRRGLSLLYLGQKKRVMKELQAYVNHWIIDCACGGSLARSNVQFDPRRIFTKASSIASKFQELTYQTVPKVNRFDCTSLK